MDLSSLPIEFGYVTVTDNGTTTQVLCGGTYTCSGGSAGGDIEIYLDGVLIDTQTTLDFNTETVNVEWL